MGKNCEYLGLIGKKEVYLMKPEDMKKASEMQKLFIDIGRKNKDYFNVLTSKLKSNEI